MSKGQKFGAAMLSITPLIVVFMWQSIAGTIGSVAYLLTRFGSLSEMLANAGDLLADVSTFNRDLMSSPIYSYELLLVYVGYLVIFGVWYNLMFCRHQQTDSWKQVLSPVRIPCILLAGVVMQVCVDMFLYVLFYFSSAMEENYDVVLQNVGKTNWAMIACVAVLAPIAEELIFRGLIFGMMKRVFPVWLAILLQALLFGIYHLNLTQGIYAMILGIFFGYLAYRYHSVIPGMLMHFGMNVSSYLAQYLPEELFRNVALEAIIMVVTFAIAVGLIVVATRNLATGEQGEDA